MELQATYFEVPLDYMQLAVVKKYVAEWMRLQSEAAVEAQYLYGHSEQLTIARCTHLYSEMLRPNIGRSVFENRVCDCL